MFVNVYRDLTLPIEIALSESKRFVEIETSVLSVELREQLYKSDGDLNARGQSSKLPLRDLLHQRKKPSAAGDFELAKDRVEVLFHHRQTQTGVISDLLVTPPLTDKTRNFLFARSESDEMRQTGARRRPRG